MQHLMHHVTVSLQQSKITLQNNCIDNSAHFVLLFVTKNVEFATFTQTVMIRTIYSTPEVHQTSSKAGSGINILYLLTGPITDSTRQADII